MFSPRLLIIVYFFCVGIVWFVVTQTDLLSKPKLDIEAALQACRNLTKSNCYRIAMTKIVDAYPMKDIIKTLNETSDKEIIRSCHLIAHNLGQAHYAKNKNLTLAISQCGNYCGGGCYHGVTEEHFKQSKITTFSPEILKKEMEYLCVRDNQKEKCENEVMHGLGHVASYLYYEDTQKALEVCDTGKFPSTCYEGVFMGFETSRFEQSTPEVLATQMATCASLKSVYHKACYSNMALKNSLPTITEKSDFCESFPLPYQEECYRRITYTMNISDIRSMKEACGQLKIHNAQKWCIQGALRFLFIKSEPSQIKSLPFCEVVDRVYKKDCYDEFYTLLKNHNLDSQKVCQEVKEKEYAPWCL